MKRIIFCCTVLCITLSAFSQLLPADSLTKDSFYLLTPVEVRAIRAGANAPFARTNISKTELTKLNLGQDIPFLLNQTPSVVVNSDAGNGIGYTGIRIRGTDATRINVTLNGIPYNDAESQGTFFVDLPDFSSSAGSVQVQRGVGTSSNGSGAYGASINFSTNEVNPKAYAELNNSYGSFNAWKNTLKLGTGLHNGLTSELRLSHISSDGFIDRAFSKLRSLYFSSAYIKPKNSLRLNVFTGHEKTYQAWYGISQADLDAGNRTINYAGREKPGEPYDNETDNYTQTHWQLFYNHVFNSQWNFNTALFYTRGKGYYEQYKANQTFASYGLPDPIVNGSPVTESDFVRQLWLDNHYYGNIFAVHYNRARTQATLGGSVTRYEGNHYGKLIWQSITVRNTPYKWYDLDALKSDATIYLKQQSRISSPLSIYYDLQYRYVKYNIDGFRYNPALQVRNSFNFFNPKLGLTYTKNEWKAFISYAIANKEPNRDDFEAGNLQQPRPERLYDLETAVGRNNNRYNWNLTGFYMRYKDQLVLTGKINDVGAYTRTNIPKSYRTGLEAEGAYKFAKWINAGVSLSYSSNKVEDFTEYVDNYDNGGQKSNQFARTDIAYSPDWIGSATVNIIPFKNAEISLFSKYVSDQYLDNTSNKNRRLNSFFVQDLAARYLVKIRNNSRISLQLRINNLFDEKYEPNGYTYSYIYGGATTTENFYFPMAGRNFMAGVNWRLGKE